MNSARSPLQALIERVVMEKADLSRAETVFAFDRIFNGSESDVAIGSFLTALAMKGESDDEILGTYEAVREKERAFGPVSGPSIDICGTGGEALKTFNISTAAAIVTAASGCRVAKHGNRSMSGPCGSADFLEAIGFDLFLPNERLLHSLDKVGVTFLFAPNFHPLMKNISVARKAVGIRTILNIVGPLCNPCINLSAQLIGVSKPSLLTQIANVMKNSNLKRFMVAYSQDGFDELTNTCDSKVIYFNHGELSTLLIHPQEYDLTLSEKDDLIISSKRECVKLTMEAIYGYAPKQIQDAVVLNAAAALLLGNLVDKLSEGIELARNNILNGNARSILRELIRECGDEEKLRTVERILRKRH
jgi:anthranilate phosphoribosyltransferase